MQETQEQRSRTRLYQTFAIIASSLGLLTACGIDFRRPAPAIPPPPSQISVSPAFLLFPETPVHSSSDAQTVWWTNQSADPSQIVSAVIVGQHAASFQQGGTCARELAPGAQCGVVVIFRPVTAGDARAELLIEWDNGERRMVPLIGKGRVPSQ